MFRYQISPTRAFNIGLYGKGQGGEHTQKKVKEHHLKWADKKKGCFLSLVNQTMEVYIGGLFLFPDLCPPPLSLETENTCS